MSGAFRQAWRFASGLRRMPREAVSLEEARAWVAEGVEQRAARFLEGLDRFVWPRPESPYLALLRRAGLTRSDVTDLVDGKSLEGALGVLRDSGVYVTYEEYLGRVQLRRGSLELTVDPRSFMNPDQRPDYLGGTGGTRGGGIPVAASFADKQAGRYRGVLRAEMFGVAGAPAATWYPCLPSAAGLGALVAGAARGRVPERWFSQVPPVARGVPVRKQAMNVLVPLVGWVAGLRLPRPRYTPASNPTPVLAWCASALARHQRAYLSVYPSSAVALSVLAQRRGVDLTGLVAHLAGEPVTPAKAEIITASGASISASYVFMQKGGVAYGCPECRADEYHLLEDEVALVTRARPGPDGAGVDAFCWTTLRPTARSIFINVENDDYGTVSVDDEPCSCELGRAGIRTRVSGIRGISKVVAGGVTLGGAAIEELVERALPARLGGTVGDFQLSEQERDGKAVVVVRVAPAVPASDAEITAAVADALRGKEMGALALGVWERGGSIRVERRAPVPARSGKVLPFEPLR